ncbi:MAG: CdaR family protein, partial [Balneolaceae bacterium]
MLNRLRDLFSFVQKFDSEADEDGGEAYLPREKILVFGISFVLAFCLWFIVNLSRDFNITVELPLEVGNLPQEMALTTDPPDAAFVGVSGEGWALISLYNNPPEIQVDVNEEDVNLFEKVQNQISVLSDVNITNVDPYRLDLNLEEKIRKEVPVEAHLDIETRNRYEIIGEPDLEPQTVVISGAASRIQEIEGVDTRLVELVDVHEDLDLELEIEVPERGIAVSPDKIRYTVEVTEFTEGEARIPVRIRNLPPGQAVTYNPSTITVTYTVPIHQYSEVQDRRPFIVYV